MTLINPADSVERQNEKLLRITRSLMRRVEQQQDPSGLAYAQFERAALLDALHRQRADRLRACPLFADVDEVTPAVVGAAIKTWAFADDQFIGVSKSKGYYFDLVPAGKHVFWAKAENTSGVEVEVKGGQTYYFKTAIRMGFGKARVKMTQLQAAEAEGLFAKCDYVEPTAEGRTRAAETPADDAA